MTNRNREKHRLARLLARSVRTILTVMLICFAPLPALAEFGSEFVDDFSRTCIPQRLSFEGTVALAKNLGWQEVADDAHPELASMMAISRAEANDPELDDWTTRFAVMGHATDNERFMVVTRVHAPDIITLIGCYHLAFNATAPIDPALVTEMLAHPLSYSSTDPGERFVEPTQIISHVWGPAEKLPRTLDTYLTFIPEGSPLVASTGYSGLTLKFETSEPDDAE